MEEKQVAEFMRRFATGLDTYEFAEVRSEDFDDFVVAAEMLGNHVRGVASGVDVAQEKAINTLTNAGVRTSLPGLSKPTTTGSTLGQVRQAQPQQQYDDVELGKLDDGTIVTVHPTGKYGPYVKARNIPGREKAVIANLPKGAAAEQIDLATAIGLIEQKMAA